MDKRPLRTLDAAERRALQAVQLRMLLDFDRVCATLGLRYQLAAGTLLGAVRHQGFIPWDDDVDVAMPRADYQRLLAQGPALFHPDHFLQHWRSDPGFRARYAKLRRQNSEFREVATADLDCHQGIFIDIFPFDGVRTDRAWGRLHWRIGWLLTQMGRVFDHPGRGRLVSRRPVWQRVAARVGYGLGRLLPFAVRVRLYEWWIDLPRRAGAQQVTCMVTAPPDLRRAWHLIRPAAELLTMVPIPFEGHALPGPANPLVTLHRLYGEDLSPPPPEQQESRHRLVGFTLPPEQT